MPGNVQPLNENLLDVFPTSLYSAYAVRHERYAVGSDYPDGSVQRASPVTTTKKSWRLSERLTPAQLQELRTFYRNHIGKAFLFRDLHSDQLIKAVFTGGWSETTMLPRSGVSLEITEVY